MPFIIHTIHLDYYGLISINLILTSLIPIKLIPIILLGISIAPGLISVNMIFSILYNIYLLTNSACHACNISFLTLQYIYIEKTCKDSPHEE